MSDKRARFRNDLLEWGEDNIRSFPWREPNASPFEVLVAEIFLKQTRAPTVDRVYQEFIDEFPNLQSIRHADRGELVEIIKPLGLYNYRADAFMEIADRIGGAPIPSEKSDLLNLPQVGPYVANAVLCFAFGQDRAFVDTNVRRVYTRVFSGDLTDGFDEDELWGFASDMVPEGRAQEYNAALLDFGAEICTDQSPKCEECFASAYCDYYKEVASSD